MGVAPASIPPTITVDPADDEVRAVALAARADRIVSGDRHLLELATFRGMDIVTAAVATARIPELKRPD